tara:strand:+ start:14433 stop:14615 length:183 start_codon:yes stop_codon:yes gene_type:complete
MTKITYEEHGDIKTEDIDKYGDVIKKPTDINDINKYLQEAGFEVTECDPDSGFICYRIKK